MIDKKEHINITLDGSVLNWVDTLRGQKPRSTFINHVLSRVCHKTQATFNWTAEDKKASLDIKEGRVKKFPSVKKALQWLKS